MSDVGGQEHRARPAAPTSMACARMLEEHQETIIERWLERVRPLAPRDTLTKAQLVDSLPDFLAELRLAVSTTDKPSLRDALPSRSLVSVAHGGQRHTLGYNVRSVAHEYPILHDTVLVLADELQLDLNASEIIMLARCMGMGASEALSVFFEEHEAAAERRAIAATEREEAVRQSLLRAQQAERELRASETKYRALFDSIDAGFCIIEMIFDEHDAPVDYRFLEVNAAFERQTDLINAVGKTMRELAPTHEAHWFEIYGRIARTGRAERFEQTARALARDYDVYAFRLEDAGPNHVAVLFNDISARKRAERELRHSAEFEQQLIGIVSHDLKNPLSAILFGASASLRSTSLDDRTTRALVRIRSSAERATRLVSDLLDFTQARLGGGIPVKPSAVDVHDVARTVLEEAHAIFVDRDIHHEASGDGRGWWDPDRLSQLMMNLIANAVSYSPSDTVVRVRTSALDDAVVIEVQNAGEPIPDEALGRLFQPLQRATSEGDRGGRSVGLGLYIVKEIVDAHAGNVAVHSAADDGTTFTVRLPRARHDQPSKNQAR